MIPVAALLPLLKDKRTAWVAGGLTVFVLLCYCYLQGVELGKARARVDELTLAYEHPATVVRVQKVEVQGPVRFKTVIVEVEGRKETTIEEVREAVVTRTGSETISTPVFAPTLVQSRWLLGVNAAPWHLDRPRDWQAYAGYSFRNRVDLLAGANGLGSPRLMVVFRF